MGYSYVYIGDATIPETSLEAWLDASTEVEQEWPDDWEMEGAATVAEVLDYLADDETSEASWDDGVVRVRALADKGGDAWLTYRADLAIAFRLLPSFGGRGTLIIAGFEDGPEEGIRIEARADGSTRCVILGEEEVLGIRETPKYEEVLEIAERVLDGVDED